MRKKISLLGCLSLLLLVGSCNLDEDKDPIIVPVLEDEFYLDLWQELSPEGASLVIEFQTLKEEDCLNAEVLSNYQRSNRNLTLTLFDILAPETCVPGSAPATGQEQLTGLGRGTYNLTIELQEIVNNEGVLSIDDAGFEVETATNGFQWRHGRLERMPAQALWGYLSYTTDTERQLAQQQLAELAAFTTTPAWSPGYYGHFELAEDGSFTLAERFLPTTTEKIPFLVHYEDATALANWLAEVQAQLTDNMRLSVFNGEGETWNY